VKAVLVAAIFGACGAMPPSADAGPASQELAAGLDEAAAARQVLVMLKTPPPHFRPGVAYEGSYPSGDTGPTSQRAAQQLAREHQLRVLDNWPMPVIGVDCFLMERAAGMPAERLLAALARDPRVAWAQPVNLFQGLDGGDPLYPVQPDGKYWHIAQLHRVSTGRGVRIAVVDSGIDASHPDLAGRVDIAENFVGAGPVPAEPHGTAVAGIVAARSGNGIGIAGVAPDAKLMALRACWQVPPQGTRCSSFTLGKALNFAIMHDARIINLSLAGPADRLLEALLGAAAARGTTVVGAIDPERPGGGFPVSTASVLAVSAQTAGMAQPRGDALRAPGTDIPTCLPRARWGFVSGTSYAAAHVSGLVALIAQLRPHATPEQLKRNIVVRRPAPQHGASANIAAGTGSGGSIDACATIARVAGSCICSCPSTGVPEASRSR
jgi:subtilisin family serine protease